MVKEKIKDKKKFYLCDECGFAYKSEELAQKCENWCGEHHSYNTEITKHALNFAKGEN